MQHKFYCGGSIITTRLVITAARCINRTDVRKIAVHLGSLSPKEGGQSSLLNNTFIPRAYYSRPTENDVGLLLLIRVLTFDPAVGTIDLPKRGVRLHFTVGSTVEALGFGKVENGSDAEILQEADFTIIGSDRCGASISQFCIGNEGVNKDIKLRKGDEGGPIIYNTKLIGIVSSIYFLTGVSAITRVYDNLDLLKE